MDFTKMTGAGNDFIVLAAASELPPEPEAIRLLCDRRYGIGADGLMIIRRLSADKVGVAARGMEPATVGTEPATVGAAPPTVGTDPATDGMEAAFSVDFYNADGSGGMLCGNGARCALVHAATRGFIDYGTPAVFSFAGRLYSGIALGPDRARFMLDPRYTTRLEEDLEAGTVTTRGRYIDLGSLHLVVDIADLESGSGMSIGSQSSSGQTGKPLGLSLEQLNVAVIGAALRNHERFAPLGVNVNFCSLIDGKLHVRTFERGVEGETLACGTGSTASALSYALRSLVSAPVSVVTRSGEDLIINFDDPAKPSWLSLEGPAKVVFEGQI